VYAVGEWAGEHELLVDLEGHGREEVLLSTDVSRTIGWFTSLFPVRLLISRGNILDTLRMTKEVLRQIPNRGLSFGALRYLSNLPTVDLPERELCFNYLGQSSTRSSTGVCRIIRQPGGNTRGAANRRPWLLSVDLEIVDGALEVRWFHDPKANGTETIQSIAIAQLSALRELSELIDEAPHTATSGDFPLADLPTEEMRSVWAQYPDLEDMYCLTPVQEGLLFHTLLDMHSGVYVEQRVWDFEGDLDIDAMRRAWQRLTEDHPLLRTCFLSSAASRPIQVVQRRVTIPFSVEDLSAIPTNEQEESLKSALAHDRTEGFDTETAPLTRVSVYHLGPGHWVMAWNAHHLLFDGWSNAILLVELFRNYRGELNNLQHEAVSRRPFRDFVRYLDRWEGRRAEAYWRSNLAGVRAATDLPLSRPDAHHSGYMEVRTELEETSSAALEAFARASRLTLNTITQAAWALLLARLTGDDDVVFGVTSSGRPHDLAGVEQMLGLFITTLPMRVGVKPDDHLVAWLGHLQAEQFRQRDFEMSSLVDIQGWSDVPRGLPLFESIFVHENYPMPPDADEALRSCGLRVRDLQITSQSHYAMRCCVIPGQRLGVLLGYQVERFRTDDMESLAEQYVALLRQISRGRDFELGALSLDTLHRHSDPSLPLNEPRTSHVLAEIDSWVERTPYGEAVRHAGRSWTYSELAAIAGRLEIELRRSGAGRGQVVAVTGERGIGLVAALLGVLRAGCVLMPVDLRVPDDRQESMLATVKCRIGVVVGRAAPAFASCCEKLIEIDALPTSAPESPPATHDHDARRDSAYVFFTSGSQGEPKAVLGSHLGLAHFVKWERDELEIGPGDRVAQLTRLSFDVMLRDVFVPLASGASVVLPDLDLMDGSKLATWMASEKITILHAVPSVASSWLADLASESSLPGPRAVLFAGEPLQAEVVRRWRNTFSTRRILNLYGPTETTLAKAFFEVPDPPPRGVQPLGWPLPDTAIMILDETGKMRGTNEPGEIAIRTPCRSLGYIEGGDDSHRFVSNSLRNDPDDLIYRTGDVGRIRTDSCLEFLGRDDSQVKVRGVRVNLEKVAAVVSEYAGVAAATVVFYHDPIEPLIVAYVVVDRSQPPSSTSIRDYVRRLVSVEAVPGAFVFLEEMPLLPNGKVDRRSLPVPEVATRTTEILFVPPRSPTEAQLARLYATLLRVDSVGIDDDFFDLGGHSLIATRLVARVRKSFGVDLPLRSVFSQPTIRALSSCIDDLCLQPASPPAEPVRLESRVDSVVKELAALDAEELKEALERLDEEQAPES
jgi:amino acid adenylation domain-containing protein/non-ribosomal peptide synthase protein (TIGR01720 family)